MNLHHYILSLLVSPLFLMLIACSSGPDEKPVADSFSSPAKHLDQGVYYYASDNYPEAIDQFEKTLLQYRSIDNQEGIANSCLNLAKTYMAVNNNQIATEYLVRADAVIKQASLRKLNDHLALLKSSLAINNKLYEQSLQELGLVLHSDNTQIRLAALKNRTRIAFLRDDSDRLQWLGEYKALQNMHPDNTASHQARILRFEAEASDDAVKKTALLSRSLAISQGLASRTAIAATLTQWANFDVAEKNYDAAEDRYLRALFIRHQLFDVKSSLAILEQLQLIYLARKNDKVALTTNWINKLTNNELSDWQTLYSEFDIYPQP